MNYRIELYDRAGRRIAAYTDVSLLEAARATPDQHGVVRGLLPEVTPALEHAARVRVYVDGALFTDAFVTRIAPQWSDTRKLILDRYVNFHRILEFEAVHPANTGNTLVRRAYTNRTVAQIVKSVVNTALGPIHYLVQHAAYPDGAQREYTKFLARKMDTNELEIGGIASGDWVDASRVNATGAFAKDGDTIAGLVVDGEAWPDLRLMLIDSEETERNSHAIARHPEVADWTDAQHARSGYKLKADAAKAFLQDLLDTKGIDFIELNPHKNALGEYDDRVDAFGRYLGFVYGSGECLNAAMVENGHADVFLYEDGAFHVPEMELKDYFSYTGPHAASIADAPASVGQFEAANGALEVLAALAYLAGGYVFSVDESGAVHFRKAEPPDRVVYHDPRAHALTFGSDSGGIVNFIIFEGNPVEAPVEFSQIRADSAEQFGVRQESFSYFSLSNVADAETLLGGLLDDLAYPAAIGELVFLHGDANIRVGDLVELRGEHIRRLDTPLPDEWGGRFDGKLVARAATVTHRFQGRHVSTTASFGSPLRSVANPLQYITRSQRAASQLAEFRLDDPSVALDTGYHLD